MERLGSIHPGLVVNPGLLHLTASDLVRSPRQEDTTEFSSTRSVWKENNKGSDTPAPVEFPSFLTFSD